MSHKSKPGGINIEFEPFEYTSSYSTLGDDKGNKVMTRVWNYIVNGDSYHTITNAIYTSSSGNDYCKYSGDRIQTISDARVFSVFGINYYSLLAPDNSADPYSQYKRYIPDGNWHPMICRDIVASEIISKIKTPYETFESSAASLNPFTTFFSEDLVERNFTISGFDLNYDINNSPDYYDELVLYNRNGQRIDQKLMNIIEITDPANLRGIFSID